MSYKKLSILLIVLLILIGAAGSYFFLINYEKPEKTVPEKPVQPTPQQFEDFFYLRIYYPIYTRIHMEEKKLPKRIKQIGIAEAVIEEFFKGFGDGKISHMPRNVKLLGLYKGPDQILYIDLSDELRRDFQGDAFSEYLLLKGLYESLIANLQDFYDFKILVEGKEIETLGGRRNIKKTLKNLLPYEFKEEIISLNE
jgi:spore germination protein GerM